MKLTKQVLKIIPTYLELNTEICGYIFPDGKDVNLFVSSVGEEIKENKRGQCTPDGSKPYIWHTHPSIVKQYPSAEDILKVLNPKYAISVSLVFSVWGIWKIASPDKIHDLRETKALWIDKINRFLATIYHSTNRGRVYEEGSIKKTIKNICRYIYDNTGSKLYISLHVTDYTTEYISKTMSFR